MTVTLNEPAIAALFSSLPIIERAVEKQAEAAASALQGRLDQILWRADPADRPVAGFVISNEGAIIGIDPNGPFDTMAVAMDKKLAFENWWDAVGEAAARGA